MNASASCGSAASHRSQLSRSSSAIYCGVPDANTAFRIAQRVLTEIDELDGEGDA